MKKILAARLVKKYRAAYAIFMKCPDLDGVALLDEMAHKLITKYGFTLIDMDRIEMEVVQHNA